MRKAQGPCRTYHVEIEVDYHGAPEPYRTYQASEDYVRELVQLGLRALTFGSREMDACLAGRMRVIRRLVYDAPAENKQKCEDEKKMEAMKFEVGLFYDPESEAEGPSANWVGARLESLLTEHHASLGGGKRLVQVEVRQHEEPTPTPAEPRGSNHNYAMRASAIAEAVGQALRQKALPVTPEVVAAMIAKM